jgi:hypothetical protein
MVLDTMKKNVWYQKVDGSDYDFDPEKLRYTYF